MNMPSRPLRLGTRGSPLALVQARMVAAALCAAHGWPSEAVDIHTVRTTGDAVQDRPLAEIGGKALWTKELDRALLDGEIDFAVHSMKDVETIRPEAIRIAAMLPRADVRDRLVGAESVAALPRNARIGTSSPRRAAQLRHLRPDLAIVPFRGNVDTRLRKLEEGEAEATLLAAAGLDRLERPEVGHAIPIDTMLPAPAQGAVGIEARAGDEDILALLTAIDHAETHACVLAERAFLAALGAGCHSPVGAMAAIANGTLTIRAEILSEDGALRVGGEASGEAAADGTLADRLLAEAPPALARLFTGR
ncbi:hydroxymethylbilane synthase [Sphingomonas sp. PR090111-T3T-6A]|uniref:hydroxymethylbilane synthase n=1 Tax=Sphingomonas sp. PR090111-T3T-6A TaxID=685778 RepID=UPI00035F5AC0|nr:hydroxymethylbilane synthase [Sphingomonas sp. PR090111-T3T-6A]